MEYQQIKPLKGSEIVMTQIKQRIENGELKPGEKLASVVDLAAAFGVGRSTVREALSALKAIGMLDIQQGGGTYVMKPQAAWQQEASGFSGMLYRTELFKEVLEVRKYIETGCAALAAKRRTEADLAGLAAIIEHMALHLSDESASELADIQFHLLIARASHNSLLLNMMESLTQRLHESMKESRQLWFYGERASAARLLDEHTAIYEAIRDGSETAASERMMQHLQKVDLVVQKLI